jgi:hypothetical protein
MRCSLFHLFFVWEENRSGYICASGFVADYLVHNKFEDRRSAKSALLCNMNVGSQSSMYLDSIVVVARCRGKGYGDSDGVLLDHVRYQQHPQNVLDQDFLPRRIEIPCGHRPHMYLFFPGLCS